MLGCGGGGGGDDAPPTSFELTSANAIQAAGFALRPLEQMFIAGGALTAGAWELAAYGGVQREVDYCGTPQVPIVVSYTDRDASGNVSVGDVIDIPPVSCSGFPRKLTLTLTQVSATLDEVAGSVEMDFPVDSRGMEISGSFDVSLSITATTLKWRIAKGNAAVIYAGTSQSVSIASSETSLPPASYAVGITGGGVASSHLGGSYTFATSAPFTGTEGRLPTSGELVLTAPSGSRVRLAPPAQLPSIEAMLEWAVAPSPSGAFGPTQQTLWTAVVRGALFRWSGGSGGGSAPVLSLSLTPANPDTTVDLVAVTNVVEPNGDPVTLSYEWTRNGVVIAGTWGAVLPASQTTRGDVITVRVRASDGVNTVEATATTTIVDAPTRVTAVSPPSTIAYGAPVTFRVTVEDPDGDGVDEMPFVLVYGPAGMTVDATTGVVSWTADGPIFDRSMQIGWGIAVEGSGVEPVTGTFEVTSAGHGYPQLRFGTQTPVWPAGLAIDDFDDDGDVEVLVMGERWLFELASDGAGGYRQTWAYPYALDIVEERLTPGDSALATGDVDGDGRPEIFAAVGATITMLDGAERRAVATTKLASLYESCFDIVFADLENDGAPELVCMATTDNFGGSGRIVVLHANDLSQRAALPAATYGPSLAVGNVDGDAALEIVTSNGHVIDGATLVTQWLYQPGFGRDVDTGDFDGDGVEEITAAADWYAVRGFSATLRSQLWETTLSDLDSLHVANVDGDARPEILIGDGQSGNVTIYSYNTATNAIDVIDQIDSQNSGVTSIGVGDVDADGGLELIWGSGASTSAADVLVVAGRNPTLTVEWINDDPAQLDGPFKGGELAGGPLDPPAPLFLSPRTDSGYRGSRLIRMPTDGAPIEVGAQIERNSYGVGALDVVDYDSDGVDEAFLATNAGYDPLYVAYDPFADAVEWSSGAATIDADGAIDVAHADVTGDGIVDLIGLTISSVYVYDVYQQSLLWQGATPGLARRAFAVDIDGNPDGELEIVIVARDNVYTFRHSSTAGQFTRAATYAVNTRLSIVDGVVGDTDGDGNVEILLLAGERDGRGTQIIRLDADLQSTGTLPLPWEAATIDIEPSMAARKNLLLSRLVGNDGHSAIAIVGAESGGVVFESPPLIGTAQPGSVHFVTLPGETRPRISIGTSDGMYLTP